MWYQKKANREKVPTFFTEQISVNIEMSNLHLHAYHKYDILVIDFGTQFVSPAQSQYNSTKII